jgi:hypothetical protein
MAGRSSQDPRTVLEHLLREQDRTYDEVVRDFEKLGRKLDERGVSITARHLRRLASGERVGTTPATRRVLQALFGLPIGELLRPWFPAETRPISTVIRPQKQSDVELLAMAAERAREFSLQNHVVTSTEAIERLTDEVRHLTLIFQRTSVPAILGRLLSAQDAVLSSLELRQKPSNAQQLYFLAAVIAGMLAHAGNDLGKPQVALAHARTAFMWAEYADHNGLRAWIRGTQSYICYWANQPREAIRYAQAGAEFATAARGTAVSWLFASEARAWATLGNTEQAKALIERAAHAHDRAQPGDLDDFGGPCTFARPKRLYYAARALATLPDEPLAAETYAVQAVEAYQDPSQPNWDYNCQADSHVSLVLARISRGELDGVSEPLRPVFELPPEQRVHDIISTINIAHQALNKFASNAQARNLQEEIEFFTRTSLPHFPV